ncbi:MAG: alpha/beta hydrolase [Alphaproteobacteria bacterium CG_4_9_14_3_um_filter_47_13]|nr:MAG: alpha/beta hydrolase [Alphaproteobacteria bacterium CG_4_9_14_3_um_filter_47_13]
MPKHNDKKEQKTVNLALQGGGAHGAFTWGVLDKLLEDGRINIDGICATSAGTMNACAMAWGMHKGGNDGARQALHDFWKNISDAGQKANPIPKMPWEKFMPQSGWMKTDDTLSFFLLDSMTRLFSPYQLNPFDFNPLRDVLEETINFDELRECDCVKLFISATHVHSGKVRVFDTQEIDLDVVMASACLPYMFKAVEVDGEDYWDGGYMGNPALFPLFYETDTRDVMIVHINPMERNETPESAHDITNRINEISFNSSLLKELRAIAFVKKLIENDMLKDKHKDDFTDILVHSVRSDEVMTSLSVSSKFSSEWDFLTDLRDKGRNTMTAWLEENYDDIGIRDTVDLHGEFLNSNTKIFENHHGDHKHKTHEIKRKTA